MPLHCAPAMLIALLACSQPDPTSPAEAETAWIEDISATTSAVIPTVIEVTFTSPEAGVGWVEFSAEAVGEQSTPRGESGTAHRALVVGGALQDVQLQAVVEVDGERHVSGTFSAETGQLLPGTPVPEVTVSGYDGPEHAALLMSIYGSPGFMVMMDLSGEVLWSLEQGDDDHNGIGLLPDGDRLRFNLFGGGASDITPQIVHIDLAGEEVDRFENPEAHHFFTIDNDETITWIQSEERAVDGVTVRGDTLWSREPDGAELMLFSAWNSLTLPDITADTFMDWTHGNWVRWDSGRGSYLFSMANTNTVLELSPGGEPLRKFGGPGAVDAEYTFGSVEQAFAYPHGAPGAANGDLLVFSTADGISRAVRYDVDDELHKLTEVWSHGEELGLESLVLGEVQELPDGNILVSWGSIGMVQIVSPAGEVLWEMLTGLESFVTQLHLLSDPYTLWQ